MTEVASVTPYYDDGQVRFLLGDVRDALRELPDESVQCVVTSPPYWSLRDYGVPPSVWGERDDVDGCPPHEWVDDTRQEKGYTGKMRWQHIGEGSAGSKLRANPNAWGHLSGTAFCSRCGAWRGALGMEPTPDLFVLNMVEVFREVRRVLRRDGTLWLNLGDSYAAARGGTYQPAETLAGGRGGVTADGARVNRGRFDGYSPHRNAAAFGLKHKDLVGIPWRTAFALQADGWYLRSDCVWAKPNPLPESVTDRPTKAHEYVFLLSKSERYYYDYEAVKQPAVSDHPSGNGFKRPASLSRRDRDGTPRGSDEPWNDVGGKRNLRSVWTIPVRPFPGAHFATFPPALVTPCILAGAPEGGVVLDPFVGSGTTAAVAKSLGRRAIGIDLNPEYLDMAIDRCRQLALPMQGDAEVAVEGVS